jgi:hypothetical protein
MKVTTLNLMIACQAKVSLSPRLSSLRRVTMQHIQREGQQPIDATLSLMAGEKRIS